MLRVLGKGSFGKGIVCWEVSHIGEAFPALTLSLSPHLVLIGTKKETSCYQKIFSNIGESQTIKRGVCN